MPTANGLGQVLPTTLAANGRLTVTRTTVRDIWFTGDYESLMAQKAGGFLSQLQAWNAVAGFMPNPKSLWEATPFSWLIDYFTNSGDFIHSTFMAGIDGSVLVRGYVMCRSQVKTEYTWEGNIKVAGTLRPHTLTWYTEEVIKQRESARPYGVGFTGEALIAKQLSILTALGISALAR